MPNLVLPVVYHMQVTSVYEYLELRYNSSLLMRVVSLCVLVTSQMFLVLMVSRLCDGIADSIGVSRVYPYIVMGASIAIPCSGVLAIVWSSLWQTIVVIAAIATLLSTNNSQSVITTMAMAAAMPDSDDIVHTMAPMAGQVILWSAIYGCHQAYTARYCSARSILQARLAIGISIVVTMVISVGAMLAGMVIRDMLGHSLVRGKMAEQSEEDSEELETGLAGVIVSAVAAAVISTFSSVTLSLAASVWEDFLYQSRMVETTSQTSRVLTIRILSLVSGLATLLLSYFLGHHHLVLHLAGVAPLVMAGPVLAIFLLGLLVPCVNMFGVAIGMVAGTAATVWIAAGATLASSDDNNDTTEHSDHSPLDYLYSISEQLYPLIGFTITCLLSIASSLLSKLVISTRPPPHLLLHPMVRRKDPTLTLPPMDHAWTSQEAHYRWPSPSLPPTLKKPRPSVDTLTLNRKGGLVDTINRRGRKQDSWRSSGYDNNCYDSWGSSGGTVHYKL